MTRLTRWSPVWQPSTLINELMDRPFRSLFDEVTSFGGNLAMDVNETDTAYRVQTELPGVDAEHIHVAMEDDILTIEGEIPEQEIVHENERSLVKERRYGKFSRSIRLPHAVDTDKINATYENGILELSIPKAPEKQPKRIEIKAQTNGKNKK